MINPFTNEIRESRQGYPNGWRPKKPERQRTILSSLYPDLDGGYVKELAEALVVPEEADGIFILPKLSSVAVRLGIKDPFGEDYGRLLEATILAHLRKQRGNFYDWCTFDSKTAQIRLLEATATTLQNLERETRGDFLVFAAQTGSKYAGFSFRAALWEIEHAKDPAEFPLPTWCVGNIIYTHPERLHASHQKGYDYLFIDCAGDESKQEMFCLGFDRHVDGLRFSYHHWASESPGSFGSASAFL